MILQEEAKILALLSGKIDKDEDLAGEKKLKSINNLFSSIGNLSSKDVLTVESRDELNEIKKIEQEVNTDYLIDKQVIRKIIKHDFLKFKTTRSFTREI